MLMFVGGCAGSTGGGLKVIRHVLFGKVLRREVERAHRPRVVREIRVGGASVDDPSIAHNILVYFTLFFAIFGFSWIVLVTFEPDSTWGSKQQAADQKLVDTASAVAATLNNIGPGLGVVGATKNYEAFSQPAKLLFTGLMMLGRVELFSVLVLCFPGFWRRV